MSNAFGEGIFIGLSCGLVIAAIVVAISDIYWNGTKELGQSICEKEYNMDYDGFKLDILSCKPKEMKQKLEYDGTKVVLKMRNEK